VQEKVPLTRNQKVRWYAEQLMREAAAEEKAGNGETAVSRYLRAADMLLLLAKVEENYTAWKYYADSAALCQQRARRLVAMSPTGRAGTSPESQPAQSPRS
jgi:hypothetical protein